MRNCSIGKVNSSAAICVNVVRTPCPISVLPAAMLATPSDCMRIIATDTGVAPALVIAQPMPTAAFLFFRARFQ